MSDWRPPILETERLYLRPIELSDADSIFAYASNEEVALNTSWYAHDSMEATHNFIENYVFESYANEIPEPWGITLKENPEMLIGTVGLTWDSKSKRCMRFHYGLSDTFWGQGIIPEAGRAILDYGFKICNAKRIRAYCTNRNPSAARCLEKVGFLVEGVSRSSLYSKGEYRDACNFGVLDTDWAEHSKSPPLSKSA